MRDDIAAGFSLDKALQKYGSYLSFGSSAETRSEQFARWE